MVCRRLPEKSISKENVRCAGDAVNFALMIKTGAEPTFACAVPEPVFNCLSAAGKKASGNCRMKWISCLVAFIAGGLIRQKRLLQPVHGIVCSTSSIICLIYRVHLRKRICGPGGSAGYLNTGIARVAAGGDISGCHLLWHIPRLNIWCLN